MIKRSVLVSGATGNQGGSVAQALLKDGQMFQEDGLVENKIISNSKLKMLLEYEFKYPDLLDVNEDIDNN